MKKYLKTISLGFQLMTAYRARSIVWLLTDLFILFIMPFLWLAAYGDASSIAGFDRNNIVTYFLGVAFIRVVVSSHLEIRMQQEIKDGKFSNYLVKPMNHMVYTIMRENGWRLAYTLHFIPILIVAIIIFKEYLIIDLSFQVIIATGIALLLSYFLFSLLNYIVGLSAMYLVDADSTSQFFWLSFSLFSGMLAPLVFFPQWLQSVASVLPFKYLVSFPLETLFGNHTGNELLMGYGLQILWILICLGVISIMFRLGVRKYEGVGI